MKLKELINRYDTIKPFNNVTQLCQLKELLELLKNKEVNKITDVAVSNYISKLKTKGNSNKTINDKLSILRCLLKYAYSIGKIQYIPLIPNQKVTATKTKILSRQELALMLAHCHKAHLQELARVLLIGYYTGLRINNILSINHTNYSVVDNILSIYDKK
jgi:site-specific recombinase XerD